MGDKLLTDDLFWSLQGRCFTPVCYNRKENISCCFISRISYTVLLFRAVKHLISITFYTTLLHTSYLFLISNYLNGGAPQSEIQTHNLPYSLWRWVLQISSVKTLNLVSSSMISSFKQSISWWRDVVGPLCWAFRTRISVRLQSTTSFYTSKDWDSTGTRIELVRRCISGFWWKYTIYRREKGSELWVCVCLRRSLVGRWFFVFSWRSFRPRDMLPSRVVLFLSVFECVRLWFGSTRPIYVLIFIFCFVNCS